MRLETKTQAGKIKYQLASLLLIPALIFAAGFGHFNLSQAANVADLEQVQKQKEKELQALKNEISEQQREIANLLKQGNSLQNQISLYNAQINQSQAQVLALETQIEISNEKINELRRLITEKENQMEKTRQSLAEMIRQLYQMDRGSSAMIALMNNDSFSEFMNEFSQMENVQGKSYELLQEVKRLRNELEQQRTEVESHRAELNETKTDLEKQQQILTNQVSVKDQLLRETKGNEQTYRQLLAQSQAEEDVIQNEINDIEAKIREQMGEIASPAKAGEFVWPMKGYITQRYGRTGFTSLGYSFHNGMDIAAAAGTPIYAAANGIVNGTGSGEAAYGNWVTIKHELPNGRTVVTLYAHMLRISVKNGQVVKAGQAIGTEGNTGNTTRLLYGPHRGFHLHFTVFDGDGFRILSGANQARYGPYQVPTGYTYDPMDFL